MIKLKGKWEPRDGVAFKYAYRGDERREFSVNGDDYRLSVDYTSGYWSWSVRVNGKTMRCNAGFGQTSKRAAKERAEWSARQIISDRKGE